MEEKTLKKQCPRTGIATLLLGILSLVTILLFINYLLAIVTIIVGVIFIVKNKNYRIPKKVIVGLAMATTSIIMSSIVWCSLYSYFTKTDIPTIINDVNHIVIRVTDGEVNLDEEMKNVVDDTMRSYVENLPELKKIEKIIGKELNYEFIKEFVGEAVNIERISNFVGDGLDTDRLQEAMTHLDYDAMAADLENDFSYLSLEKKLGKDFTYEELVTYLESF